MKNRIFWVIIITFFLGMVKPVPVSPENSINDLTGKNLPLFILKNLEGKRYNMRDHLGKVILINFFFVGCKPCEQELPVIEKISNGFNKKDFELVVINGLGQDTQLIKKFFKHIGVKNINTVSDLLGNQVERFKVDRYPTSFLVNRQGKIESVFGGFPEGFEEDLKKRIERLL